MQKERLISADSNNHINRNDKYKQKYQKNSRKTPAHRLPETNDGNYTADDMDEAKKKKPRETESLLIITQQYVIQVIMSKFIIPRRIENLDYVLTDERVNLLISECC